jgi:hypothetical protein
MSDMSRRTGVWADGLALSHLKKTKHLKTARPTAMEKQRPVPMKMPDPGLSYILVDFWCSGYRYLIWF